jgi:hypothetical protein
MPKIRDLGINVIPATMRPPEIGQGGGYAMATPCVPSGVHDSEHCGPPPQCAGSPNPPKCDAASPPPGGGGGGGGGGDKGKDKDGLKLEDVHQLQQQMQDRIAAQF